MLIAESSFGENLLKKSSFAGCASVSLPLCVGGLTGLLHTQCPWEPVQEVSRGVALGRAASTLTSLAALSPW